MPRPRNPDLGSEETSEEAQAVSAQVEEEQLAEEKREAAAERASELKGQPEGALPPTERPTRDGEPKYARAWLLDNALALTGHPTYVVAGALYGNAEEYLTVEQAKDAVDAWLAKEVTS